MRIAIAVMFAACLTLSGCESPEAARTRGGGPGADTGNRAASVRMHEGSRQFWKTPVVIPGESLSLEPARQAQQLSQP
jgi:uncharacterized protein YceK